MTLPRDPRVRLALAIVGGLVVLGVVLAVIDRLSPAPEGPASSSYATAPAGLAAYASLLERNGHPVRRVRTPIADREPRAGETLVVLDPDVMEPQEARAIGDWVRGGGRLVAGGVGDASWLESVLEDPPEWAGDGPTRRRALVPVPAVEEVVTGDRGAWHELGGGLPVVGPADAPLLVTARSGRGTVSLLADPWPLQNRGLARADGAALGLALAAGGPVAFLETVHGYGAARGFAGLPANVRWALIGLGLTALVAIWSVGRRFGPPEDPEDDPAPPRADYVDALAAALVRAGPEER